MINRIACQPARSCCRMVVLLFLILNGTLLFCLPEPAKAMLFPEDSQSLAAFQSQGTPSTAEKPSLASVESAWRNFLQAYKNRNLQEIDSTLYKLLTARKNADFANASSYSLALLALAQQAHERHDETGAGTLIDQAIKLSPGFSFSYQARSQWHFSRNQWLPSLHSCVSGIKSLFSNYQDRLQFFAGLCFIAAFLPLWLLVVTQIILTLKYFRSLRESWERKFNKTTGTALLFIMLLAANALLWRPIMFLPGLMLIFTCVFPLYTFKEKLCSLILVALLIISPFAYLNGLKIIDCISSPFFQSVMAVNFDYYQKNDKDNISLEQPDETGRSLQLFSLATAAGKEKRISAAISFFEELAGQQQHPEAAVYNNLGNYYYLNNQIESAVAAYKKAISINPHSGIYHYNLSHAYIRESFALAQSEAAFIQAWKLSPEIINRQLSQEENANNPVLVQEPLPWTYVYNFVKKHSLASELKNDFYRQYFSPWSDNICYFTFIGIILIILGVIWIKTDTAERFCPLCGLKFHGIGRITDACPSCLHISRQEVSDSFSMRQRKKIRSFSWLMDGVFIAAGLAVPGTYQIALGQTIRGIMMLCGSFAILSSFALLFRGIVHVSIFPPGSAWWPLVLPLLLMTILYAANFFSWRRRREQHLMLKTVLKN